MKQTDKRAGIIDRYYMPIYDTYFRKNDAACIAACLYVGLTNLDSTVNIQSRHGVFFLMLHVGFILTVLIYWLMLHYVIYPNQLEGIFVK